MRATVVALLTVTPSGNIPQDLAAICDRFVSSPSATTPIPPTATAIPQMVAVGVFPLLGATNV